MDFATLHFCFISCLCCMCMLALCVASLVSAADINNGLPSLGSGSSFSPENKRFLLSPDGTFSAGFYRVGDNAYSLAIWYSYTPNLTVVWIANRDEPVNGRKSLLRLQKDGDFLLMDADRTIVWKSNTRGLPVKKAELLSTGNLVLRGTSGNILWQSFDYATDTLLPYQPFTKNIQLVSRMELGSYRSGYYRLFFDDENVLSLIYDGLNVSSKYWPEPGKTRFQAGRTTYNSSRFAFFDGSGRFSSSDELEFNATDYGDGPKRRLTLDVDGNLRLYSLDAKDFSWHIRWIGVPEQCRVHGLCGVYGLCAYTPEPKCRCPPGFQMADSTDWFKGCRHIKELHCGPSSVQLIYLPRADYYGFDNRNYGWGKTFEDCKRQCMNDCNCLGFGYIRGTGRCLPKNLLVSGLQTPGTDPDLYIKISINSSASVRNVSSVPIVSPSDSLKCRVDKQVNSSAPPVDSKKRERSPLILPMGVLVAAIGFAEIVCIGLGWWYMYRTNDDAVYNRQGYFAFPEGFKRFSFSELKRATNNFNDVVGKGGFGTVYKGYLLSDNKVVAVKRLEGVSQGEEEFWAEVSVIGKVHHMNLVRMFGFCAEGKQRLLVYEYVENGSLDNYLFTDRDEDEDNGCRKSRIVLDWKTRFQIALGTAKGLAYLHEECLEWILHCDIKPQNILLDGQFRPKVSDFGLSKLVGSHRERALTFSRIRGTRGYLAPEWTMNLPITSKADVYSFGILLLELLTLQNAAKFDISGSNFAQWARESLRRETWTGDDHTGNRNDELKAEMESVLKTALLCIGQEKDKRPSMSQVVEMLTSFNSGMDMDGEHREPDFSDTNQADGGSYIT